MFKRIYIFAETYEHAARYIAENQFAENQCVIVRDVGTIQGAELEHMQIKAIGHWYNNHLVSLAYDYAIFNIRKREIENARNH